MMTLNPQKKVKDPPKVYSLAPNQCDRKTILVSWTVFCPYSCLEKCQGRQISQTGTLPSFPWQARRLFHQLPLLVPAARGF